MPGRGVYDGRDLLGVDQDRVLRVRAAVVRGVDERRAAPRHGHLAHAWL